MQRTIDVEEGMNFAENTGPHYSLMYNDPPVLSINKFDESFLEL